MKTILFRPFEKYAERILLAVGLAAALIALVPAAYFDVRFNGVLDMHFIAGTTVKAVALDLLVDFVVLSLFLFAAGWLINRKTRAVDMLSAVLIAKIPMYLLVVFNAGGVMVAIGDDIMAQTRSMNEPPSLAPLSIALLVVFIVFVLTFIVWSVALLYNGYKTAANAKGTKAVVLFIAALLLAEIASQIILAYTAGLLT